MFLFGYPGNGKTSIAERITAAFGPYVWIPRAITMDRDIVRVFDPMSHEECPLDDDDGAFTLDDDVGRGFAGTFCRWRRCRPTGRGDEFCRSLLSDLVVLSGWQGGGHLPGRDAGHGLAGGHCMLPDHLPDRQGDYLSHH